MKGVGYTDKITAMKLIHTKWVQDGHIKKREDGVTNI
jgi:hypothetical protein